MGGFTNSNSSLSAFTLPLLGDDENHSSIVLSAMILNVDEEGK